MDKRNWNGNRSFRVGGIFLKYCKEDHQDLLGVYTADRDLRKGKGEIKEMTNLNSINSVTMDPIKPVF